MSDTSRVFFRYHDSTIWLDKQDDDIVGAKLDLDTGTFIRASPEQIRQVLSAPGGRKHPQLAEAEFIAETENARRLHLTGDGPVFPLYELIDAIYARAATENRALTDEEEALIILLYQRTYRLWEHELAARATGQPASFYCAPKRNP